MQNTGDVRGQEEEGVRDIKDTIDDTVKIQEDTLRVMAEDNEVMKAINDMLADTLIPQRRVISSDDNNGKDDFTIESLPPMYVNMMLCEIIPVSKLTRVLELNIFGFYLP